MVQISDCKQEITPDFIKAAANQLFGLMGDDTLDVILMTTKVQGALMKVFPPLEIGIDSNGYVTICGIPFESFQTLQELYFRASEIRNDGKRLALICG